MNGLRDNTPEEVRRQEETMWDITWPPDSQGLNWSPSSLPVSELYYFNELILKEISGGLGIPAHLIRE